MVRKGFISAGKRYVVTVPFFVLLEPLTVARNVTDFSISFYGMTNDSDLELTKAASTKPAVSPYVVRVDSSQA